MEATRREESDLTGVLDLVLMVWAREIVPYNT